MASKQLQIRAALAALLAAGGGIGCSVFENRDFSLATGVAAQVHVNLRSSEPFDMLVYTDHPRDWRTEMEFVVLTRKSGVTEASDAADALWVAIYQRLMATAAFDEALNVWELLPGEATVDVDEADTSLARLTWLLTVHHRTTNNTLT